MTARNLFRGLARREPRTTRAGGSAIRDASGQSRGLSSVEVLVAAATTLLLLAGLAGFGRSHARVLAQELGALDLGEATRRGLESIAREIRTGGFDPLAGGFDGAAEGLAFASTERIELLSDLHGASGSGPPDGTLDPASDERITFYRGTTQRTLYQAVGNQILPLSPPGWLPPGGLAFRFFDACGGELVPPAGNTLGTAERAAVQRIGVSLLLRDPLIGTSVGETMAVMRNRASLFCP